MEKKKNLFVYLWPFLSKNKISYVLGFVFLILTCLLGICIPYFLKHAIDALSPTRIAIILENSPFFYEETYVQLIHERSLYLAKMAAAIIATSSIFAITRVFSRIYLFKPARLIEYKIRNLFFTKLLNLPLRYFHKNSVGDLMSRATNDLQSFRAMLGFAILNLFDASFTFILVLVAMLWLNWKLALIAILPFPLFILVLKKVINRVFVYSTQCQESIGTLSSKIQENFNGIQVIKSYVQEKNKARELASTNQDYYEKTMKLVTLESMIFPFFRDLPNIILPLILVIGGNLIISDKVSMGTLVAFFIYLKQLSHPTMAAGWMINIFQRGRASIKRIREVLETHVPEENTTTFTPIKGELEFKNISFKYGENLNTVLDDISFHIKPGTVLGILGKTGSGKSTLTQLIMRNLAPDAGEILLDKKPLHTYSLAGVRKAIGYVPQSSFLFSKKLRDNIYFGLREDKEDEEKLNFAITTSHLKDDIDLLYKGLDTIVGEKGITLSGGQRQRAAISRAIIDDHEIYIFDDSFSSVDHSTEEEILKQLKNYLHEKTCIFISHRVSTLKLCDSILYLEDGKICEMGTHEELLSNKKNYYRTYALQNLETVTL